MTKVMKKLAKQPRFKVVDITPVSAHSSTAVATSQRSQLHQTTCDSRREPFFTPKISRHQPKYRGCALITAVRPTQLGK